MFESFKQRRAEKAERKIQKENLNSIPQELMMSSENEDVNYILRQLDPEKTKELSDFSNELSRQNFSINPDLDEYNNELFGMTYGKTEALKNYTGYNYKYINSVARGFWNYDELGRKTPEAEANIKKESEKVSEAIASSPRLPENMKTFRGTNMDSFRGYGVSSLDDLENLKGQLFYERGFTSTSMSKEDSFFDRDFDDTYRKQCDIEIEYLIPGGTNEGVALQDENFSYSTGQNEYLLDKYSLCRIMDVKVEDGKAQVKMVFIPKEIWTQ